MMDCAAHRAGLPLCEPLRQNAGLFRQKVPLLMGAAGLSLVGFLLGGEIVPLGLFHGGLLFLAAAELPAQSGKPRLCFLDLPGLGPQPFLFCLQPGGVCKRFLQGGQCLAGLSKLGFLPAVLCGETVAAGLGLLMAGLRLLPLLRLLPEGGQSVAAASGLLLLAEQALLFLAGSSKGLQLLFLPGQPGGRSFPGLLAAGDLPVQAVRLLLQAGGLLLFPGQLPITGELGFQGSPLLFEGVPLGLARLLGLQGLFRLVQGVGLCKLPGLGLLQLPAAFGGLSGFAQQCMEPGKPFIQLFQPFLGGGAGLLVLFNEGVDEGVHFAVGQRARLGLLDLGGQGIVCAAAKVGGVLPQAGAGFGALTAQGVRFLFQTGLELVVILGFEQPAEDLLPGGGVCKEQL